MPPEFKTQFENPTGSFSPVEKRAGKKSNDFLITLVAIMLISGAYAIWFFYNLPSDFEPEYAATPRSARRAVATEIATSTVDMTDWKTYRNEEYGFEFKYPSFLKEEEHAPAKDNDNVIKCLRTDTLSTYFCMSEFDEVLINSDLRTWFDRVAVDTDPTPQNVINISIDGQPAIRSLFIYPGGSANAVFVVNNNKIYKITYPNDKNFNGYYDQILSTFKFTK